MKKLSRLNLIIILAAVFVLQVLIIILLNVFSSQNIKNRKITQYLLKDYKSEEVNSIKVEDANDSFTVEKTNDFVWQVLYKEHKLPADEVHVKEYLDLLKDMTKGVVVSSGTNGEDLEAYGFGSSSKLIVTVKMQNGKEHTISVGNPGSGRGTSNIRYNNDKKIREIKSYISTQTSNQYISWAKKIIFSTDIQGKDIKTCEFIPGNDPELLNSAYTIRKLSSGEGEEEKTVFETIPAPDGELDYTILNTLIYNIIRLSIDEYKLEGSVAGQDKAASVKLTLMSGKEYTIDFYQAEENDPGDYSIKVSGEKFIYLLSKESARGLVMHLDSLVVQDAGNQQ